MFMKLMVKIQTLLSDEKGQGMVEYALIIAGIAVVVFVAIQLLGGTLIDTFEGIVTDLGGSVSET